MGYLKPTPVRTAFCVDRVSSILSRRINRITISHCLTSCVWRPHETLQMWTDRRSSHWTNLSAPSVLSPLWKSDCEHCIPSRDASYHRTNFVHPNTSIEMWHTSRVRFTQISMCTDHQIQSWSSHSPAAIPWSLARHHGEKASPTLNPKNGRKSANT